MEKTTPAERAVLLNKLADVIDANKEHLAMVESMDNGKPIRETLNVDIPLAAQHFRYFAGAILAEEGSATMLNGQQLSLVLHEPLGVVGQIIPWNFPFLMGAWKLAPVLAAGDCTVLKPSKEAGLTLLEFARLADGILPPGVFNIITAPVPRRASISWNTRALPNWLSRVRRKWAAASPWRQRKS